MKKIHILILILSFGMFTACDSILDVELDDEIKTSEAITDIISLRSAVIGLYDIMQSGTYYGGEFILAQALTGGIADATGFQERFAQLDKAIIPTSSDYIKSSWVDVYALVNASNLILEKMAELNLDDENAKASALFFRALGHFDALRQFGQFTNSSSVYGIPVVTKYVDSESSGTIARATVAESFGQIITDLNAAIALFDYDDDRYFVSKATAEALLARVYLYQGNYPMAEQLASDVIGNNDYALNSRFNDIYDTEGSDEAIFELQFLGTDGNSLTEYLATSPPEVSANYQDFFRDMDADDDPRSFRFYDTGRVVYVDKYGTSDNDIEGNAIIIKLSEMYLIRAEARARQTPTNLVTALQDLNKVRTRSLPSRPILIANVPDFNAFVNALLIERARELAFEGHRWFDIVRLGKAESILGIPAFRTVYPIPQREVSISKGVIVQNPQY
ncbi:RagB/SusD family nutrient uptake outer membrane protein [Mariniflexile sp.]|uniref:RagB/SusD family nutrient uptake outer membrane protein n=1 Tax=Mariniflexile sp. TaxID=1979402 RepID=UPI004048A943